MWLSSIFCCDWSFYCHWPIRTTPFLYQNEAARLCKWKIGILDKIWKSSKFQFLGYCEGYFTLIFKCNVIFLLWIISKNKYEKKNISWFLNTFLKIVPKLGYIEKKAIFLVSLIFLGSLWKKNKKFFFPNHVLIYNFVNF